MFRRRTVCVEAYAMALMLLKGKTGISISSDYAWANKTILQFRKENPGVGGDE